MKLKKQMIYLLVLMLLLCIFLTGCGDKPKPVVGDNGEVTGEVRTNWTDDKGLITIRKEDCKYYIYYDLEKWEEIHDITKVTEEEYLYHTLADRELLIDGIDEGIKDIAIVSIDGYGGSYILKNDFPIIFMLMDSGKVTWMFGYPPMDGEVYDGEQYVQEEQYSYGYLPYLEDIVSFSYEKDGEGIGALTLFAIDKEGLRYDMRHILDYSPLVYGQWNTFPSIEHDGEFDAITIFLTEEGDATMYKTKDGREVEIRYEGTYEIYLDDSSSKGYRAPSITLDVKLAEKMPEDYKTDVSFKGTFLMAIDEEANISFYHIDGDTFKKGVDSFTFTMDEYEGEYSGFNIWYLMDEEFIEYFLNVMPEVRDKVEKHGMALLVEGSTDLTDYGLCRDISLGTNHADNFVREIHYTVTEFGIVFEYNPLDDLWYSNE